MVVIVVKVGVRHAQRAEDLFLRILLQRHPCGLADDLTESEVAGVRIQVVGSGREVELTLARDGRPHFGVRVVVVAAKPPQRHEREVVAESTRVMHHLSDRRIDRIARQVSYPPPNRIVQGERPLLRSDPPLRFAAHLQLAVAAAVLQQSISYHTEPTAG